MEKQYVVNIMSVSVSLYLFCAVLYRYLWPVSLLPYFPTLFNKQHFFSEKVIEHVMWVLIFSFLILRRILCDIMNVQRCSCKVRVFRARL